MKLRCKLRQGSASASVASSFLVELPDTGTTAPTLANFLAAVASRLNTQPANLRLSLNGRDPLLTDDAAPDATTLASLGLVSGDLVYVSYTDAFSVEGNAVSSSGVGIAPTQATTSAAASSSSAEPSASASISNVPILVGDVAMPPMPKQQRMQARLDTVVPLCPSLQLMQRLYSGSGNNQLLQLTLALHCLMVETGFLSVDSNSGRTHQELLAPIIDAHSDPVVAANRVLTKYLLPSDFAGSTFSYAIHYVYGLLPSSESADDQRQTGQPRVLLKVVRMGRLAVCHCTVLGGRAGNVEQETESEETLQTLGANDREQLCYLYSSYNLDQFVTNDGYRLLRQLSIRFKDAIAERAKAAIHEACGLTLRGLSGLPAELLLRIMRSCHDAASVCRLGEACRRLRMLHVDNYVWRVMLVRHYRNLNKVDQYLAAERQGHEVNYYEAYRIFHEERVQRRRMLARLSSRELAPIVTMPAPGIHDFMPGVMPPILQLPQPMPLPPPPPRHLRFHLPGLQPADERRQGRGVQAQQPGQPRPHPHQGVRKDAKLLRDQQRGQLGQRVYGAEHGRHGAARRNPRPEGQENAPARSQEDGQAVRLLQGRLRHGQDYADCRRHPACRAESQESRAHQEIRGRIRRTQDHTAALPSRDQLLLPYRALEGQGRRKSAQGWRILDGFRQSGGGGGGGRGGRGGARGGGRRGEGGRVNLQVDFRVRFLLIGAISWIIHIRYLLCFFVFRHEGFASCRRELSKQ